MTAPTQSTVIGAHDETRLLGLLKESWLAQASVTWDYRRQADESLTVGFVAETESGGQRGYLKTYSSPQRALSVVNKQEQLAKKDTAPGAGAQLLGDQATILYLFPYDHSLRYLRLATTLDKLKRAIKDANLLPGKRVRGRKSNIVVKRYKPEKRLLAHLSLATIDEETGEKENRDFFMRVFPDERGAKISQLTGFLRNAGLAQHFPHQVGSVASGCIQIEELRAGRDLSQLSEWPAAEAVASLIAHLGQISEAPCQPISSQAVIEERLETLNNVASPEAKELVQEIALSLVERSHVMHPEDVGVVHGDLHPKQFLFDGEALTLVDLERSCLSHPAIDAGHFLAELQLYDDSHPDQTAKVRGFGARFLAAWSEGFSARVVAAIPLARALGFLAAAGRVARQAKTSQSDTSVLQLLSYVGIELARIPEEPQNKPEWVQLYPGSRTPWAGLGVLESDGREEYGQFDPETGTFRFIEPAHDEALPGLAHAINEGELISWRPGRRAVVKVKREGDVVYRKLLPHKKLGRAVSKLSTLADASPDVGKLFPRLVHVDQVSGFFDLEEIRGESLHVQLMRNEYSQLSAAGVAVAAFHGISTKQVLPTCKPEDLAGWLERTSAFFPQYADDLRKIHDGLPEGAQSHLGVLHGDLHDKNIIVNEGHATIIDVDGVAIGPRARDVGNMMAHLQLRGFQLGLDDEVIRDCHADFVRGYQEVRRPLNFDEVEGETERATFRLICVYLFRRQWQEVARRLMRRALAVLVFLTALIANTACVSIV
ncbi:MAG: aminoglycoside phosphotransferase (APT) family kinase protein, partial [Planctomycetota bacterium]